MHEEYWGLKEKTFQNTPDPRFFYYSKEHEEALSRLTEEDTGNYVVHRLKVAGRTEPIFSPEAMKSIFTTTGGIPIRINHLCKMSLLIGFGRQVNNVDEAIVQEAAKDLAG